MAGKDYGPQGLLRSADVRGAAAGAGRLDRSGVVGRMNTAALHRFQQLKGGEPDDEALGLVTCGSLAGGKGLSGSPCRYCGEVDGHHTGQCPVVSFGGPR